MRFKRLRRAVGISIVLFILIVGIIMLAGLTHNQNSNVAVTPSRNGFVGGNAGQSPVQRQQSPVQPAYHPMFMTGAS